MLVRIRQELAQRGLACELVGVISTYELTADGRRTLRLLTTSGEQRFMQLLDGWHAEQHAELVRLTAAMSRELLIDSAALRQRARPLNA